MGEEECPVCNIAVEVEPVEDAEEEGMVMCLECGEEFKVESEAAKKFKGFCVAKVLEVEDKGKVKRVKLDVGEQGEKFVATNAKYIEAEDVVVVALEGAVVPAGADPEDGSTVTKATVHGVKSEGMLCDCPALGWTGGAAGKLVKLEQGDYSPGDLPPLTRPTKK